MARPIKEELDYFPLNCDLDDTVGVLEAEFGNDGFAALIKFWQAAYKSPGGVVNISTPGHLALLAKRANLSVKKYKAILSKMEEVSLMVETEKKGYFTSSGIQKRKNLVEVQKKRWRDHKNRDKANMAVEPMVSGVIHVENGVENGVENPWKTPQSKVKESKVNGESPYPLPGSTNPESLGASAEKIIREYDGIRTLEFEEILSVIEGQRDPSKKQNVSFNEKGHLHKIYYADGHAENLTRAVIALSKTPWRGTLEQIAEVMGGKNPENRVRTAKNGAETAQGASVPMFKPTPRKTKPGSEPPQPSDIGTWDVPF